jgi:hypothetical protein
VGPGGRLSLSQQPLEINDELLSFVAVQMNIDSERISDYALWQHTVSEHQARIQHYLGLRPFDLDESNALERFALEESCRLEQTALLLARAQEFLLAIVLQITSAVRQTTPP